MGDRVFARITIGGDVARDKVGELAALLAARVTPTNAEGDTAQWIAAEIERVAALGESLELDDYEVNYARFGCEDELERLGFGFDTEYDAGVPFAAGTRCVRPGRERRELGGAGDVGQVVVASYEVRRALDLIGSGHVDDAVALLKHELGDDIEPVGPLRIV